MRTSIKVRTLTATLVILAMTWFGTAAEAEEIHSERNWKFYSTDLSVEKLKRAYREDPKSSEKRLQLVDGLLRRSIEDRAKSRLRAAINDYSEVLRLTQDLSVSPNTTASMRAYALVNLSTLLRLFKRDLVAAEQSAKAAFELLEKFNDTSTLISLKGNAYSELGQLEEQRSRFSEALRLLAQAIKSLDRALEKDSAQIGTYTEKVYAQWLTDRIVSSMSQEAGTQKAHEQPYARTLQSCDEVLQKLPKCTEVLLIKTKCLASYAYSEELQSPKMVDKVVMDNAFAPAFSALSTYEVQLEENDEINRNQILLEKAILHSQKAIVLNRRVSSHQGLVEIGEALRICKHLDESSKRTPHVLFEKVCALETAGDISSEKQPRDAVQYYRAALRCYKELLRRWPDLRRTFKTIRPAIEQKLIQAKENL